VISPSENDSEIQAWKEGEDWTNGNNSYALLFIGGNNTNQREADLRKEWRDSASSEVVIGSDRNTGTATAPESVHTEIGSGEWTGGIVWNDGHTGFEQSQVVERTVIGGQTNRDDDILTRTDTDTAAGNVNSKNTLMKSENP
jgi:hypothetical protein